MKIIVMLLFLYSLSYADTMQKIWHITPENDIVSVEEMPVETLASDDTFNVSAGDLSGAVAESDDTELQSDIENLPLARTFPVQEKVISSEPVVSGSKQPVKSETMQERIAEIQSVIEKETQIKKSTLNTEFKTDKKVYASNSKSNPAKKEDTVADKVLQHQQMPVENSQEEPISHSVESIYMKLLEHLPGVNTRQLYFLAGFLFLFLLLGILLRRKKEQPEFSEQEPLFLEQQWNKKFGRYSTLKGEIHQQFLVRKQNILFNHDFTQYQKAKALLELEKEYTDLEYIYLPKLFGDDFAAFIEAEKVLSSKPELREMVQDFIEETLAERPFTKVQREHILRNIKQGYRTSHYNWQFDDMAMQTSKSEDQGAYFIQ